MPIVEWQYGRPNRSHYLFGNPPGVTLALSRTGQLVVPWATPRRLGRTLALSHSGALSHFGALSHRSVSCLVGAPQARTPYSGALSHRVSKLSRGRPLPGGDALKSQIRKIRKKTEKSRFQSAFLSSRLNSCIVGSRWASNVNSGRVHQWVDATLSSDPHSLKTKSKSAG